jgi:16S rRNA (guanine527-N7)-methyltransferase
MSWGNLPVPPDPLQWSADADKRLRRWLERLVATPGLTAIRDPAEARRVHLEESLAAVEVIRRFGGPIVDVGSGGGAPGIPLAAAFPERQVTLLEANGRKCAFLRDIGREFPNVEVVQGRAEEQEIDSFGAVVAKALGQPPVAAEWCLPLAVPGGAAILYVGPTADAAKVSAVSKRLGGSPAEQVGALLVLEKLEPTPPGFPRRPGVAKKRPLA